MQTLKGPLFFFLHFLLMFHYSLGKLDIFLSLLAFAFFPSCIHSHLLNIWEYTLWTSWRAFLLICRNLNSEHISHVHSVTFVESEHSSALYFGSDAYAVLVTKSKNFHVHDVSLISIGRPFGSVCDPWLWRFVWM